MDSGSETLEAMQARHRKEQRDLQSRITNKKKNATKKTRKGVNDECAELERVLREQQGEELAVLNGDKRQEVDDREELDQEEATQQAATNPETNGTTAVQDEGRDGLADELENISISNGAQTQGGGPGKKRNRQQERMARRRAEQEAAAVAAEEEASNMTDHRAVEKKYLLREFEANGLVEEEIRPDGHCLFSAVADQLSQKGMALGSSGASNADGQPPYKTVRRRATDYMEDHRDDFAPFLEEDFEQYVRKIRDTAEWGGQLELKALADAYGVEIKVVQDGRTETIEPGTGAAPGETPRIWLAYYRHGYGLGEHYNSLRKAS
ncbi:hypothetical protein PFICI_07196 [Pestalotiopsis fici W106-1]|uniref:OTU domain-containing protein n=1 Tax=Pestalotiopsis fici (strain W106-1 / CGMCC3.15140) TaxID=1229662 RepID=W3X838_PESFW|nr:uncharacterized protein PFICI_07196 [Pestalotiopsis fici W106-1]ETS82194.1 hypothetical protein PFICI_07196 [Pestalotiopsis fici W106-1]